MMKHKISFICAACCLPLILSGCGSRQNAATTALENGSLSDAAKDKLRTILSDLSDDDNNILVLYKIK